MPITISLVGIQTVHYFFDRPIAPVTTVRLANRVFVPLIQISHVLTAGKHIKCHWTITLSDILLTL